MHIHLKYELTECNHKAEQIVTADWLRFSQSAESLQVKVKPVEFSVVGFKVSVGIWICCSVIIPSNDGPAAVVYPLLIDIVDYPMIMSRPVEVMLTMRSQPARTSAMGEIQDR